MSRSSIDYNGYTIIGGTHLVRTVCSFILKAMDENWGSDLKIKHKSIISKLYQEVHVDMGFILIELNKLIKQTDIHEFVVLIDTTINYVESFGESIPLNELERLQKIGYIENDAQFRMDMPTEYALDFLKQTKLMLENPEETFLNKNTKHYKVYKWNGRTLEQH